MANTELIREDDRFIEYKYTISEFYAIINGKKEEIPTERITGIKIENHFEHAIFPIFKITLVLERSRYYRIIENRNNVKFKLRMQKYYSFNGSIEKSMESDVINDLFIWFPEDSNKDYEKDILREEGRSKNSDDNELDKLTNEIELFLFKENVTGIRSNFNAVLNNIDLQTAVAYLLSKANVKHIMMSPFDNNKQYETIILPPLSIDKQIQYLSNTYGFHKTGTVIFFGLDSAYIIDYNGKLTAYKDKENSETVIYVLEKSNTKQIFAGLIKRHDEEKDYYVANSSSFSHQSISVPANVVDGTNPVVIDTKVSSSETNQNTKENNKSSIQTIGDMNDYVIYNTTSNPYMSDTLSAQQKASSNVITIALEHTNIDSFKLNKKLSIVFEDASYNKLYKGNYNIMSAIHIFTNNGNSFYCTSSITLKKVD